MDTAITIAAGFLGVLVGAFIGAYASSRAGTRIQGYMAARLAMDGLRSWTKGVEVLRKRAPNYPGDETYDVHLAMDLASIRPFLTMEWWESSRGGLVVVANSDQWNVLSGTALACRGIIMLLADIGDVGNEVWMKRAEALADPVSDSTSESDSDEHPESTLTVASTPEMAKLQAEARQDAAEIRAKIAESWKELRVFRALLDYRLGLVGDVRDSVLSADSKFEDAMDVCRTIEKDSKGPLGLAHMLRRRDPKAVSVGSTGE